MFLKIIAILSVVVLPILGQYIHDGKCPTDVFMVPSFDINRVRRTRRRKGMIDYNYYPFSTWENGSKSNTDH